MLCQSKLIKGPGSVRYICAWRSALFAWLISHQTTVLFSQNKPATNNQSAVLFSQNKPASAISHHPNKQAIKSGINQKLGSFTT
jgi:hypothetical protein